jgi:hypothetical protein
MNQMKKSAPQTAKGKMRASNAQRDANGRFLKAGQEDYRQNELFVVQPEHQPEHQPGYQPESSLYITTTTHELDAEKKRKPFERFVLSAMEDTFWKELVAMRSGLPLFEKETEIVDIFIRHVVIMGNENSVISIRDAKNYFANFTRKGTATNRAILEELLQAEAERQEKQKPNRYEDFDPVTGQRSYCGIPIPPDAPPRPDENMVWNTGSYGWER